MGRHAKAIRTDSLAIKSNIPDSELSGYSLGTDSQELPVAIAFVFPPGGNALRFEYHLGVGYIQAYLLSHGIGSRQIVPSADQTFDACAAEIVDINAPIIGFSCYDSNSRRVRELAQRIKRLRPHTVLLAGGPTATFSSQILMENIPEIDVAVRFEGEQATLELVNFFTDGRATDDLGDISSISYRCQGRIIQTPCSPLLGASGVKDSALDILPSPYLSGIFDGSEIAGVLSARGCTYHCTYCNFAAMSRRRIRRHSVERLVTELKVIDTGVKAGRLPLEARRISINDDAFTLNATRAKRICRSIIAADINLELSCMCRADTLDEELVVLFKEAGFRDISFGVESAVPEVLRTIKKVGGGDRKKDPVAPEKHFLDRVINGVHLAKRHDMKTRVSIILGLPSEDLKRGKHTIDFVERLGVDFYYHNILRVYPGTELYSNGINYGIETRFSSQRLQHETQHAYPVDEVRYGNNSTLSQEIHLEIQTFLLSYSGMGIFRTIYPRGIDIAIVEADPMDLISDQLAAVSPLLSIRAKTVLLFQEGLKSQAATRAIEQVEAFSPFSGDTLLAGREPGILDSSESSIRLFNHRQLYHAAHFTETDFQASSIEQKPSKEETNWVYSLYRPPGNEQLTLLAEADRQLEYPLLPGVFCDGCRWGRTECPAQSLKRIVIRADGQIAACLTGPAIGEIGMSLEDLKSAAHSQAVEIQFFRGCAQCVASDRCPKCLSPVGITPEEYCYWQREKPRIANIVITSNLTHTLGALHL